MLVNSSALEHLKISDVEILLSTTPSIRPIRLTNLHSIEFRYLRAIVLDQFLRSIDAPHCQIVTIGVDYEPVNNESFILDGSLRLFEPLFLELHRKSGGSKFYARRRTAYWRSRNSSANKKHGPSFDFITFSTSFISSLLFVERVLDSVDLEGLEVGVDVDGSDTFQDPEVVAILGRLRSATQILASTNVENSQAVLQILCSPSQLFVQPFPSLRRLRLCYSDVAVEEILHIVQTRFTHRYQYPFKIPDLEITVGMEGLIGVMPCKDLDFATVTQIRSIDGVKLKFHFDNAEEGMLAAVWEDGADGPA